jgi:uncharacterized protein (DUF983 family)
LFSAYLRLADRCAACAEDFRAADPGDGPAVFVIFIVGALVVPVGFILQMAGGWSPWAGIAVAAGLTILLSLLLLPPFKGVFFATQWANRSGEGRPRA